MGLVVLRGRRALVSWPCRSAKVFGYSASVSLTCFLTRIKGAQGAYQGVGFFFPYLVEKLGKVLSASPGSVGLTFDAALFAAGGFPSWGFSLQNDNRLL